MVEVVAPLASVSALCSNKSHGSITEILIIIIGGLILGLLGKFFAPGSRDNIPLWLTLLCGIGGMLLGNMIYTALGGTQCGVKGGGFDWIRHIVQVITAAVLVVLASGITGRSRAGRI